MARERKTARRKISNLLALSLLNLLVERPMYPYEMAATLRQRGKDEAIKIHWGSLYTVVQNLEKYGFIEAVDVAREGRQPERTTYQITDAGRQAITNAAPGHVATVRNLVFDALSREQVATLKDLSARVLDRVDTTART